MATNNQIGESAIVHIECDWPERATGKYIPQMLATYRVTRFDAGIEAIVLKWSLVDSAGNVEENPDLPGKIEAELDRRAIAAAKERGL